MRWWEAAWVRWVAAIAALAGFAVLAGWAYSSSAQRESPDRLSDRSFNGFWARFSRLMFAAEVLFVGLIVLLVSNAHIVSKLGGCLLVIIAFLALSALAFSLMFGTFDAN